MEDPFPDGSDVAEVSFRFQQRVPRLAGRTTLVTIRASAQVGSHGTSVASRKMERMPGWKEPRKRHPDQLRQLGKKKAAEIGELLCHLRHLGLRPACYRNGLCLEPGMFRFLRPCIKL